MANNRIHLVCQICKAAKAKEDAILIGKYYPNTGWYRKLDGMDELLDKFFIRHEHRDVITDVMWGTHIGTAREVDND